MDVPSLDHNGHQDPARRCGGAGGGRADAASLVLFSDHDLVKGQMVKEANVFSN